MDGTFFGVLFYFADVGARSEKFKSWFVGGGCAVRWIKTIGKVLNWECFYVYFSNEGQE